MKIYFNNPIFSIIIPCFNASEFICRCVDSLMAQTFPDFEIICVDDSSEDNTWKKLRKYGIKDSRISCYRQPHGGAGNARNEGYSHARGEYILFLDADDFYEKCLLEKIYKRILNCSVDIIIYGSDRFDNVTRKFLQADWTIKRKQLPKFQPFNFKDVKNPVFESFMWWGWDRAYKKSFIDEYKLSHQEITSTNDLFFNLAAFFCANKIAVIDDILVHHTINNKNSISNNRFIHPENFLKALAYVWHFLLQKNLLTTYSDQFARYCEKFSRWHLEGLSMSQFEQLWQTYEKYYAKKITLGNIDDFKDLLLKTDN